jgi:hypothetical protein
VRGIDAYIRGWIEHWNESPRRYVWTKTADQIFDGLTLLPANHRLRTPETIPEIA